MIDDQNDDFASDIQQPSPKEYVEQVLHMYPELAVRALLRYIGDDPDREGLKDTPQRVLRAWSEWGKGYGADPQQHMTVFEDGSQSYDEMVLVANIPVVSKCEHHLADIVGIAHVAYIPDGCVIGLSKLARVTDLYARRLQVQERLTVQIADCFMEHLKPKGVAVLIKARHHCMLSRGVKIHGSVTVTSAMRGVFAEKAHAKQEFLSLCRDAEKSQGAL